MFKIFNSLKKTFAKNLKPVRHHKTFKMQRDEEFHAQLKDQLSPELHPVVDEFVHLDKANIENAKKGRTLTALFFGTCSQAGDGSLLADLLNDIEGEENIDYAYVHGPGTNNSDHDKRWSEPPNDSQFSQILTGAGRKKDVLHMLAVVRGVREWWPENDKERRQPLAGRELEDITTINVIWWSRGGHRATEFIHALTQIKQMTFDDINDMTKAMIKQGTKASEIEALQKDIQKFKKIQEVNIFGPELVAGFGSSNEKATQLSPLVKTCVSCYAINDHSFGFSPSMLSAAPGAETDLMHLFFPGHHATLVGYNKSRSGKDVPGYDLSAVGKIIRHMAQQFLIHHGTKFKSGTTLNYSHDDLIKLYENIIDNLPGYESQQREAYTFPQLFGKKRKCIVHGNKFHNVPYSDIPVIKHDEEARDKGYINSHHEELIAKVFNQKYGTETFAMRDYYSIKCQLETFKVRSIAERNRKSKTMNKTIATKEEKECQALIQTINDLFAEMIFCTEDKLKICSKDEKGYSLDERKKKVDKCGETLDEKLLSILQKNPNEKFANAVKQIVRQSPRLKNSQAYLMKREQEAKKLTQNFGAKYFTCMR